MRNTLSNVLARGVVALSDGAKKLQRLQVRLLAGELKDDIDHLEPYGFTARPLPGAEVLVGFIDGDRSHGIAITISDRRFRLTTLQHGEVALYTDENDSIHFKRGKILNISTGTLSINASTKVTINTPQLKVTGEIQSDGDQIAASVSQKDHTHTTQGSPPTR